MPGPSSSSMTQFGPFNFNLSDVPLVNAARTLGRSLENIFTTLEARVGSTCDYLLPVVERRGGSFVNLHYPFRTKIPTSTSGGHSTASSNTEALYGSHSEPHTFCWYV